MSGKVNFLGLDERYTDFEGSAFTVLPICYDRTASYLKGTAHAPLEIIKASEQLELFDEMLFDEFYQAGIHTLDPIGSNEDTPEDLVELVHSAASGLFNSGKKILGIGGEHTVSVGLIKAAKEKYSDLSVLQIDAHADLRDEYEGSKFSHACVMRRVFDMQIPSVQVGIRSFDMAQYEFMQKNNLQVYSPVDIMNNPNWISEIITKLSDNVYITLDIDGLDCSAVPGTGTPEPGGMNYHQVIDLIYEIGRSKNIISADVVEVIPGIAGAVTEFTAARLCYKLIAAMQLKDE